MGAVMRVLLLLLAMGAPMARANFHVMDYFSNNFNPPDYLYVVPSNNFGCGGLQSKYITTGSYPDCGGGWLHIPDGQCGWSGVTIRPACSNGYFGSLHGASGESQGDCYWNDSGNTVSFDCSNSDYNVEVFDRLVCYSSMCGS